MTRKSVLEILDAPSGFIWVASSGHLGIEHQSANSRISIPNAPSHGSPPYLQNIIIGNPPCPSLAARSPHVGHVQSSRQTRNLIKEIHAPSKQTTCIVQRVFCRPRARLCPISIPMKPRYQWRLPEPLRALPMQVRLDGAMR